MTKRLTRAEEFYLSENPDGKTAKELAKELGFSVNIIKKYIPISEPKSIVELAQSKKIIPNDEDADSRIARRYAKNGQVIATVMTPGASEISDKARDKRGNSSLRKAYKSAIHKPKG